MTFLQKLYMHWKNDIPYYMTWLELWQIRQAIDHIKVIPLKLFYYQTFLENWHNNIHDMNIKKMQ